MSWTAVFGYFADRYHSRKVPFVAGLAALGLSTIFFMISVSPYLLLVARSLQGISAAAVIVVGLAMVADNVEKERVAESMGYVSIAMSVGSLMGPTVGGVTFVLAFVLLFCFLLTV